MIWVRIVIRQDGDLWSAYCEELELASCGATGHDAEANLKHAIIAYCRALQKRGILEKRLEEKGIQFEHISPRFKELERDKQSEGELCPVLVGAGA